MNKHGPADRHGPGAGAPGTAATAWKRPILEGDRAFGIESNGGRPILFASCVMGAEATPIMFPAMSRDSAWALVHQLSQMLLATEDADSSAAQAGG